MKDGEGLTPDKYSDKMQSKGDAMSLEYQRYGRNKQTLVNSTYINSGEYRNKFDNITDNSNVNRIVYAKAKEMLKHRSGTMLEDMYWIDGDTGKIVASALNEKMESSVAYTIGIAKAIQGNDRLIAMHTHPSSMPPSIADFNSAYQHGYMFSMVICHDGTVYAYTAGQNISKELYEAYIANYIKKGYNEKEAQLMTLEKLKTNYDIDFWEVK